MTIAVGILASDGVVIAADREEGDGYLKTDTGKVSQTFKGTAPIGSIAITGAGTGPYLDEAASIREGLRTRNRHCGRAAQWVFGRRIRWRRSRNGKYIPLLCEL